MTLRACSDCDPLKHDARHVSDRVSNFIDSSLGLMFRPLKKLALFKVVETEFTPFFLRALVLAHIVKEVAVTPEIERQIYNRTLVVFHEARIQGLVMKIFMCGRKCTKFFSLECNGKKILFDELPTVSLRGDDVPFSDKYTFKQELKKYNFPVPDGVSCSTYKEALGAVKRIGYPVVIKPRCGSLSKHTTCNILTENDLRKAVESAKIIAREFVVERHVPGDVYRITVVGGRVGGCCLREAPHVVGDGEQTIRELVAKKNTDPRRGSPGQKNITLHHISLTPATFERLKMLGMTLDSIPEEGKKIYLHSKVILGAGADIHDRTDEIHCDNIKLFEDVTKIWNAPLIGFDAIFQDISQSWRDQECGIIEANSKPYIDMHHVPVTGQPRNIAKLLIDYALTKNI